MDYLVRTAIYFGLPPVRAIQMASINTARYFGLKNLGAIAPGFRADFILLDDLESFRIFLNGKRINTSSSSDSSGIRSRVNTEIDILVNVNNNNNNPVLGRF
jgi:adenine deaminase